MSFKKTVISWVQPIIKKLKKEPSEPTLQPVLKQTLSTVQMPPGIPVATVSVGSGGAKNAAVLAAQILALKYPEIDKNVKASRDAMTRKAEGKAEAWVP